MKQQQWIDETVELVRVEAMNVFEQFMMTDDEWELLAQRTRTQAEKEEARLAASFPTPQDYRRFCVVRIARKDLAYYRANEKIWNCIRKRGPCGYVKYADLVAFLGMSPADQDVYIAQYVPVSV